MDTAIFSRVLYQLSYLGDTLSLSVRNFTLGGRDCQARYLHRAERSNPEPVEWKRSRSADDKNRLPLDLNLLHPLQLRIAPSAQRVVA